MKVVLQIVHMWKRYWFFMWVSAHYEYDWGMLDRVEEIVQKKYGGWKLEDR